MLELRCFGGVAAVDEAGAEVTLRSRKHLGLLLYLVAHPRTIHTREELAYLLWNDNERRERHSLSQALYDIRSNVGPVVEVDANTVRLLADRIAYEPAELERAVRERDHATALALYRGDFATNLRDLGAEGFDRWLDGERESCRVLATLALRNAQRDAEERGDWDELCLAALRLIKHNEFDEEAHCALMRGLWLKGDPASALDHYRSIRDRPWVGESHTLNSFARHLSKSASGAGSSTLVQARPALLGRQREFRLLKEALEAAPGRPTLIILAGESGVGKTALLHELSRAATSWQRKVSWLAPESPHAEAAPSMVSRLDRAADVLIADLNVASDVLDQLIRPDPPARTLIYTTRDVSAAVRCEENGRADAVVVLERLSASQTCRLLRPRFRDLSKHAISLVASASDGNPALAVAFAYALDALDPGVLDSRPTDPEALLQVALGRSTRLAALIDERIRELDEPELRAARLLATLQPGTSELIGDFMRQGPWKAGVDGLRRRGWLREQRQSITLAIQMFAYALRLTSLSEACDDRKSMTNLLRKGAPHHRLAAAQEILAAGHTSEAIAVATRAATEAAERGDRALASRAATFAFRNARRLAERGAAGLLAAEVELDRGCPKKAEYLLREVALSVEEPHTLAAIHSGLVRAAIAQRKLAVAEQELAQLRRTAGRLEDESLTERVKLQAALLTLSVSEAQGGMRSQTAATALERILRSTARLVPAFGDLWTHAARDLVWYHASRTSRVEAERVFALLSPYLAAATFDGEFLVHLIKAALEVRAARPDTARSILTELVTSHASSGSRLLTVAMNNLAVTLVESGDFAAAGRLLKDAQRLERALDLPMFDQLYASWNYAQCLFYVGDWSRAIARCEGIHGIADTENCDLLAAQALSLLGLCHLRRGHVDRAIAIEEDISAIANAGPYHDDRYMIFWLQATLANSVHGEDPTELLVRQAEYVERFDELGAMKLRVLAAHAGGGHAGMPDVAAAPRRMRILGGSWFDRLAARCAPRSEAATG